MRYFPLKFCEMMNMNSFLLVLKCDIVAQCSETIPSSSTKSYVRARLHTGLNNKKFRNYI